MKSRVISVYSAMVLGLAVATTLSLSVVAWADPPVVVAGASATYRAAVPPANESVKIYSNGVVVSRYHTLDSSITTSRNVALLSRVALLALQAQIQSIEHGQLADLRAGDAPCQGAPLVSFLVERTGVGRIEIARDQGCHSLILRHSGAGDAKSIRTLLEGFLGLGHLFSRL